MIRLLVVQTSCCLLVLASLASAEGAALLLDRYPSSAVLWWLNLDVFRAVQQSTYFHSPLHDIVGAWTLLVIMTLVGLTIAVRKRRFPLAVSSHLCLILMAGVGRSWLEIHPDVAGSASLDPRIGSVAALSLSWSADFLTLPVCALAALAATAAHLSFIAPGLVDAAASVKKVFARMAAPETRTSTLHEA